MVGDGCNDCGALMTADAGISLSMADASVSAHFTSQGINFTTHSTKFLFFINKAHMLPAETNISCVAPLICEGRTTLDAAFGTFQFAIGLRFICFFGVLMLYSVTSIRFSSSYVI